MAAIPSAGRLVPSHAGRIGISHTLFKRRVHAQPILLLSREHHTIPFCGVGRDADRIWLTSLVQLG
jgi:hypothetical protein